MGAKPNCAWESITAYGFRWESERLIVAEKRVMTVERRGLAEEMWSQAAGEPIGSNAHYGGRLSGDATAGPSLARYRHSAKRPSKQLRMPAATSSGEPDAGNPHVRFDEGRGDIESPSYSTGSVTHAESARPEPSPNRKGGLPPLNREIPKTFKRPSAGARYLSIVECGGLDRGSSQIADPAERLAGFH